MHRVPRIFILATLLWLLGGAAAAQQADSDSTVARSGESGWFPPRLVGRGGVVYLPKLYYSSDNKLGAGVQVLKHFRLPGCTAEAHDSEIGVKARVTLQGFLRTELRTTLFPRGADWAIRAKLSHENLKRRFWGIGSDTSSDLEEDYRPRDTLAYVEILHTVIPRLRIGVRGEYQHYQYDSVEPGGLLATVDYPGTDRDAVRGVGVLAEWDSRDDPHDPHRGLYFQAFTLAFGKRSGSDFSYNNHNVDLRGYLPLGQKNVLALQYFVYSALGDAPIWRYAQLGGRAHSRGYRRGRYIDRVLMAFQGEFRWHAFWRLGLNAFGGLANVTEEFHHLELEHMRPTVGGGVLFWPSRKSSVVIRSELAVGENSLRAYLSIGEAF